MTDEDFRKLCNVYGFAPSRALREMLDCAVGQATVKELELACQQARPEQGALHISEPLPDPRITWVNSNTAEIWAQVAKDGNVTHLDMDLCAKGPHNTYTTLAIAIWNKAIETAASKAYGVGDEGMYAQIMELKK